jgi:hypothetical protein
LDDSPSGEAGGGGIVPGAADETDAGIVPGAADGTDGADAWGIGSAGPPDVPVLPFDPFAPDPDRTRRPAMKPSTPAEARNIIGLRRAKLRS